MALSATATVDGRTATLAIECGAGAVVTVRRRIQYVGDTGSVLPIDGDVITGLSSGGNVVTSNGGKRWMNGTWTSGVAMSLRWLLFSGQAVAPGAQVWRGADGSAPILSNGFSFFGGSYTNWTINPPGRVIDDAFADTVNKSITIDSPGSLLVMSVSGSADSWTPPSAFELGTPVPAPGVTWPSAPRRITGPSANTHNAYGGGLTSSDDFGLWVQDRPAAGPTGDWHGWVVESNPWDDGHDWYDTIAFALRPAGFAVSGPGSSQQALRLAPGDNAVVVSDGITSIPLTVTVPDGSETVTVNVEITPVALDGAAGGHAATTAPAEREQHFAGSAGGQAGASSPNPANVRPMGGASGDAEGQGTLTIQPPLAGAAGGHAEAGATLSSHLQAAPRRFTLSAADGSAATFGVRSHRLAAADGTSVGFGLAPSGYYGPAVDLAGAASGHAGATAVPGVIQGLAGTASGHAAAQGALAAAGVQGEAAGHAGAAGQITQAQTLAGAAGGHAGAAATGLQLPVPLSGEAAGRASGVGEVSRVQAQAAAEGHAGAEGRLDVAVPLSGAAEGHADARLGHGAAPACRLVLSDLSTAVAIRDLSARASLDDLSSLLTVKGR